MNYRHAFHAGNFADLVKHAAVLLTLERLTARARPLTVIDTHAGRGLYDLAGPEARRSGEADAGILRLMSAQDAPAAFEPLRAAVRKLNGPGAVKSYPGSPWLIVQALRPRDRYVGCELNPGEHAALARALKGRDGVETRCADGFAEAPGLTPRDGEVLVLIDPPFEKPDDYARIVEAAAGVSARNRRAVQAVWLPLKDLETFDAFLRDLEDAEPGPLLVAEVRMRPLSDPMTMNGCAMVFVNAPPELAEPLGAACRWLAQVQGEGGEGRVWRP
ncbi:MAG: 23S rRNA (adenine(2030)-N(6))-methyltransferase RlmJ [Phenylobacterium sp.]|uniref:23S rRNA (adenine(2030)-N(6))-methyltransferase RlmJ n=1 Tax=Phenylobacterium sp. TaxID=1871053 RepID=UPI00391C9310